MFYGLAVMAEEHQAIHEPTVELKDGKIQKEKNDVKDKSVETQYELSITPDTQAVVKGVLVVKLKKKTPPSPGHGVGDVMIWWTTPGGRRSSFSIRPFSENVWVSRLVLEPEDGKNKIAVVILGKGEDGGLGETTELSYEFEMPANKLTYLGQKSPESAIKSAKEGRKTNTKAAPEAEAAKTVEKKKNGIAVSVPAIVILVVFANAFLFIPGLIFLKVHHRLSPAGGARGAMRAEPKRSNWNPVYGPILSAAGMIETDTGMPLALGETSKQDSMGDAASQKKEMFEATMVEPSGKSNESSKDPLSKSYSLESLKSMSDGDLYELVGAITEEMENSGVTDDLKKMIRAAEKELAGRQNKDEQKNNGAAKNVKPAENKNREEVKKLDLKDLSF